MYLRNAVTASKWLVILVLFCAVNATQASAQTRRGSATATPRQTPAVPSVVVMPTENAPAPVARESELTCGGFITQAPTSTHFEIIGAEQEQERRVFGEGSYVFISAGARDGVKAGQEFSVVRPRGQFKSKFSHKSGSLGVFVQEVGRVRVVRVKDQVSVAFVARSCDNLLSGDLLRDVPRRVSPLVRTEASLDRFADPTGKPTGRIVLARDGREVLTRDNVVYIDLGTEDNVKEGDYLTVFRTPGRAEIVNYGKEVSSNAHRGYGSDQFGGGSFSSQSQRVKDPAADDFSETVKTPQIRNRRPPVPRLVVGELVILHVEGRTATAAITRVAQEVHTGDFVEVQ